MIRVCISILILYSLVCEKFELANLLIMTIPTKNQINLYSNYDFLRPNFPFKR